MKPEIWIPSAISLIGALVGPWIAVKLALRRFREEEKWKERKQLYRDILESLSVVKFQAIELHERAIMNEPARKSEEQSAAWQTAKIQLSKCLQHGTVLISKEAATAIQKVLYVDGCNPIDYYEKLEKPLDETIDLFQREAKSAR